MKQLLNDANNIQLANELFTSCLIAIENDNKEAARDLIEECYLLSDSIEQRLALCFLLEMTKKTKQENDFILDNVYNV